MSYEQDIPSTRNPGPAATPPPSGRRDWAGLAIVTLAALVLILGAFWVIDLVGDDDDLVRVGITLDEIASDPETYDGQRVVVSGVVQDQPSDQFIVLGDHEVLVYVEQGVAVPGSVIAQVEGEFSHGDAAQVLAGISAEPPSGFATGDTISFIRASDVAITLFADGSAQGSDLPDLPVTAPDHVLPASTVLDNAEEYLGQQITIGGEMRTALAA